MSNPNAQAVVEILLAAGWTAQGRTAAKSVRIPTRRAPLYGMSGGEARTFGGRERFVKGDRRRATVGAMTTCFYEMAGKKAEGFVAVDTKDLARIRKLAEVE